MTDQSISHLGDEEIEVECQEVAHSRWQTMVQVSLKSPLAFPLGPLYP